MDELKKLYWNDVRYEVSKVDPAFAKLVDTISPDHEYPLYLSSYDYGETIGDTSGTLLKDEQGNIYRLGDKKTPHDILTHLGYGTTNSPLIMILDKKFEWHISDKTSNDSFPIYVEGPGFFIGTRQLLSDRKVKTYISSAVMCCTAGARSAFMLPNIGNQKNHMHLQRQMNVSHSAPKETHEHWAIFKDICAHHSTKWQAKMIFFSKKWIDCLKFDAKWIYVQRYLIEKMVKSWEHDKHHFFYNFVFSRAHAKKNIIKNPYLNETAKHILGIALGNNLGFQPSINDQSVPLDIIQQTYMQVYQLKKAPIILEPAKFDINDKNQLPVYYSLQKPNICSLEKQTKTEPRALVNLILLKSMLTKYTEEFSSEINSEYYSGTSLKECAARIKFSFYHHAPTLGEIEIQRSSCIQTDDLRFSGIAGYQFPSDAKFFRGCIRVSLD